MIVAIGSTRIPKVDGVRLAFARIAAIGWPRDGVKLVPVEAASGEADTPLSDAATLAGARRRARSALAATPRAYFAIGLEGGVEVVGREPLQAVLRNWAAVWDGTREAVGSSPAIMLPEEITSRLLAGEDLAAVIDRYAGEHDVRSRQGAFGVLTRDLITRADSYALAVVAALAPWFNGGGQET